MNRKISFVLVFILMSAASFAQELTAELPGFSGVRISQHIRAVFNKGATGSLKLEYSGVSADEINYGVKGDVLEIYLDDAKMTDKTVKINQHGLKQRESYYKNAEITAYITYVDINSLEMRGEESAVFNDSISTPDFKLRLYGENQVDIPFLSTETLSGKLYGENRLTIGSGTASLQKFNLYGENHIDTRNLSSADISTKYFGENHLYFTATGTISVFGLGESELEYSGNASVEKTAIGKLKVSKIDLAE